MDHIQKTYRSNGMIYNDMLSKDHWWTKFYIRTFWGGVDDTMIADRVLSWIPDSFQGKLLDVPVGTGVFTVSKYEKLKDAEIVCMDPSPELLMRAKARFELSGLQNVRCIQGDASQLSFPKESFDIVLSVNGFHTFSDKESAFEETYRVLKPGGCFCGCFYIQGENRRTDFLVSRILTKKGWFIPPFQTFTELKVVLERYYSPISLYRNRSMVCFHCVK